MIKITNKTTYSPPSRLGLIRHYEWMLKMGIIKEGGPAHNRLKELKLKKYGVIKDEE